MGAALYGHEAAHSIGGLTDAWRGEWFGAAVAISGDGKRIVATSPFANETINGVNYPTVGIVQIFEDPKIKDSTITVNSNVSWNRVGKINANLTRTQMTLAWTPQWVDWIVGGNLHHGWLTANMADGFSVALNNDGSIVAVGLAMDQYGYSETEDMKKGGSARVYQDTITDRFATGFTAATIDGLGLIDVIATSTDVTWDEVITAPGSANEWLGYDVALSSDGNRLIASGPYWEPRLFVPEVHNAVEGDHEGYSILQDEDVFGQSNFGRVLIYDSVRYTHTSAEDVAARLAAEEAVRKAAADEIARKAAEEAARKAAEEEAARKAAEEKAAEEEAARKAAEEEAARKAVEERAAKKEAAAIAVGIQPLHANKLKSVTFVHGSVPGKATADQNTIAELKGIVGEAGITPVQKRKRRSAALKLMFAQMGAATVKIMVIPKANLGLPVAFKATNALIVKAGEEFVVSTLGEDEGFYSVLDDGETISFKTTKVTTTFARADSGEDERYTVALGNNEKWSDIVVSIDSVSGGNFQIDGTGYLTPGDTLSCDGQIFFIGSIGDAGTEEEAAAAEAAAKKAEEDAAAAEAAAKKAEEDAAAAEAAAKKAEEDAAAAEAAAKKAEEDAAAEAAAKKAEEDAAAEAAAKKAEEDAAAEAAAKKAEDDAAAEAAAKKAEEDAAAKKAEEDAAAAARSNRMGLQFNNRSIANKFIVGSGVGAVTRSNRAAYRKRANNNAQQLPCCSWRNTRLS